MKLRNKKTGEIVDYISFKAGGGQISMYVFDTNKHYYYNSLAKLNEEWEDYEEPKEYWYIEPNGVIARIDEWDCCTASDIEIMKTLGNYFETKEEAEKAVEKLKAWKRLRDSGFRFIGKTREYNQDKHFGSVFFEISGDIIDTYGDVIYFNDDFDLLFGGE